jgi:excisionase family DNA binding protein
VINGRGLIYTVEEVSDLLGIPRPTLYRYLREYSIPHLRRSGKISIPEESFDRIREARDLHKEGLGTESVRRLLREGSSGQDTGELKERLERLSETLERLRKRGPMTTDEPLPSHALRTVLARQSLIMSAMFNLTEMVEELLLASGKPRKSVFEDVENEIRGVTPLVERSSSRQQLEPPQGVATVTELSFTPVQGAKFGTLARRRRRGFLLILSTLMVVLLLTWALPTMGSELASGIPFFDAAGAPDHAAPEGAAQNSEEPGVGSSGSEAQVEVPDVSDRGVVEAARTLSRSGFEVAAVKSVASQKEAGTVMRMKPSAGSAVEPGTPVVLITSGGPSGIPPGVWSGDSDNGAAAQYAN